MAMSLFDLRSSPDRTLSSMEEVNDEYVYEAMNSAAGRIRLFALPALFTKLSEPLVLPSYSYPSYYPTI